MTDPALIEVLQGIRQGLGGIQFLMLASILVYAVTR